MGDTAKVSQVLRSDHFDSRVREFLFEHTAEAIEKEDSPLQPPEDVDDFIDNYATRSELSTAITMQSFLEFLEADD